MARYLVVAHQTASSPELREAVIEIRRADPQAVFTLLIPATPVEHLRGWTEGESRAVATGAGEEARRLLEADGATVDRVMVGDPNPRLAVEDALAAESWDEVVVSTLPAGASRWMKMDLVSRLRKELSLPVRHIPTATP